jgi:hypothetical protein
MLEHVWRLPGQDSAGDCALPLGPTLRAGADGHLATLARFQRALSEPTGKLYGIGQRCPDHLNGVSKATFEADQRDFA